MDLIRHYPDVMQKAFELRRQGLRIVSILGKRAVHPVSLGIGRLTIEPGRDDLAEIGDIAEHVKYAVRDMAGQLEGLSAGNQAIAVSDTIPFNFLTYSDHNGAEKVEGVRRAEGTGQFTVFDRKRRFVHHFDRVGFEDYVDEIRADWTFAKFPYVKSLGFPDGILLIGPLARLNQENSILDDPEIRGLVPAGQLGASGELTLAHTDLCRLLEIYWAAKKIKRLLKEIDPDFSGPPVNTDISGKGIGVVEQGNRM